MQMPLGSTLSVDDGGGSANKKGRPEAALMHRR
jgi:hypothetical protein